VWPERQRFLIAAGVLPADTSVERKRFGMNWKMTAKTILVQMSHKVAAFAHVNRHLVLVSQSQLLGYMRSNFSFDHYADPADTADTFHIHAYSLRLDRDRLSLRLAERISTDAAGVELSLRRRSECGIGERSLLDALSAKVSPRTLFNPVSGLLPASVPDAFGRPGAGGR